MKINKTNLSIYSLLTTVVVVQIAGTLYLRNCIYKDANLNSMKDSQLVQKTQGLK